MFFRRFLLFVEECFKVEKNGGGEVVVFFYIRLKRLEFSLVNFNVEY